MRCGATGGVCIEALGLELFLSATPEIQDDSASPEQGVQSLHLSDSTLHGEFGLHSTLLKNRGIQRGVLERTEEMKDAEGVKAVKSDLRLKNDIF